MAAATRVMTWLGRGLFVQKGDRWILRRTWGKRRIAPNVEAAQRLQRIYNGFIMAWLAIFMLTGTLILNKALPLPLAIASVRGLKVPYLIRLGMIFSVLTLPALEWGHRVWATRNWERVER